MRARIGAIMRGELYMDNLKIIGHRGNQGFAPENSAAAILSCSDSPVIDGTEFDIRITKDNEIVIIHNASIKASNGTNARIQDLTLEEIEQVKFRTIFVDQFLQRLFTFYYKDRYFYNQYCNLGKQSSRIPTFESIMELFDPSKHMFIELKGLPGEYSFEKQQYFEDYIVDILKEYDYQNRNLALEGYNFDALFRIKNKLPDLKIVALINKNGSLQPLDMDFDGVSLEYVLIDDNVIDKVISNGMDLYSWDDKTPLAHYKKIRELLNSDVNLTVINDFPEKARQYIKR